MDIQQNNIGIATMVKIECYNLEKVEIQKIFLNVPIVITNSKTCNAGKHGNREQDIPFGHGSLLWPFN